MRDVILLLAVLIAFAFGYFLMAHLDKLLEENTKRIKNDVTNPQASYIMLSNDMSEEEMIEEIRKFREEHKKMQVLLCDSLIKDNERNKRRKNM